MSNDPFEVQVQHFAALKSKYQATKYEDSSPSSLLYLILRKADLEFEISKFERKWLQEHELLKTIKAIEQEPLHKAEERSKLDAKFSKLKSKFKVTRPRDRDFSLSNPLYPILWKLDSENKLTGLEVKYLKEQGLTETVAIVEEMARFAALKAQYRATEYPNCSLDSPLYQILKQLDARAILSDVEANWLFNNQLIDTLEIFWQQKAVREAEFAQLKDKYKASEYAETSVSSHLYPILKNLEADKQLSESELNWLEEHQLSETLNIVLEIEQTRHFAELKVKYKANQSEDVSRSSHLYKVLKKIDADNHLGEPDINFLKKRKLTETITLALDKFAATLKSQIQSGEPLSEADFDWVKQNGRDDVITFAIENYVVDLKIKIQLGEHLSEADIDWLKQNGREDVITLALDKYAASLKSKIQSGEQLSEADIDWANQNGREDVITFAQEKEFAALKVKYRIIDHNFPFDPFYAIMVKLEKEERLDPVLVVQLIQQKLLASHGKIAMAYHRLEALFYEQEYERTGNKWNLPNASSHWRKADEPNSALKVTENLDFDQIKENKLKSALLTTRGGAFRDIDKLGDAEKCALKAIEYQPQSHHPYTLMGAICYERGQYSQGDDWFNKAIKRGAESEDIDSELKRVVKNAKDEKRREVVEYLLKKDPQRYAWAKAYRKREGGEDAQRKNS